MPGVCLSLFLSCVRKLFALMAGHVYEGVNSIYQPFESNHRLCFSGDLEDSPHSELDGPHRCCLIDEEEEEKKEKKNNWSCVPFTTGSVIKAMPAAQLKLLPNQVAQ